MEMIDVSEHSIGCPCDHCETWRLANDPECRAAVEHDRGQDANHIHHFHALTARNLDGQEVTVNSTPPIDVMLTAHGHIADILRQLKENVPDTSKACDDFLSRPPGPMGITIGNAAFAVVACCEESGNCEDQINTLVDGVVAEFTSRHSLIAMLIARMDEPEIGGYL